MRAQRAAVERLYLERMDILETLPRKGCNAQHDGKRCRRLVVSTYAGPDSIRRLCAEHAALYREHDVALARIRSIPPRATLS